MKKTVRQFTDGKWIFEHNVYEYKQGDQVAFEALRFDGKNVVEHIRGLQAVAPKNPSGHTQIDGATKITELDKTEKNKSLVKGFVNDILMGKNMGKLISYYDGDKYVQHNIQIADGLSGLGKALEALAKAGIKMIYNTNDYIMGQGNFVLSISTGTFGGKPTRYFDLFRVENGFIAEHWDVMETR